GRPALSGPGGQHPPHAPPPARPPADPAAPRPPRARPVVSPRIRRGARGCEFLTQLSGCCRRRKPRPFARARRSLSVVATGTCYPVTLGQVVLIQFAAEVDSLWLVPGLRQPGRAGLFRFGGAVSPAGRHPAPPH